MFVHCGINIINVTAKKELSLTMIFLRLATALLGKYHNIYKIIQDTYPIIFIDEYQDTNQEIAEAFINRMNLVRQLLTNI